VEIADRSLFHVLHCSTWASSGAEFCLAANVRRLPGRALKLKRPWLSRGGAGPGRKRPG
jgi:hypothetical protein